MYESFYLNKCLQHLQEKLRWGISKSWTNKEFEKLSEQIFDASRIYISVVTLKRLFGRAKTYKKEYNPQLETKNALAIFLGYKSWQEYKDKNPFTSPPPLAESPVVTAPVPGHAPVFLPPDVWAASSSQPAATEQARSGTGRKLAALLLIGLLGAGVGYAFFASSQSIEHLKYKVTFRGERLQGRAPHTARFHYDISMIKTADVHLLFGDSTKTVLNKEEHVITHTYFRPGFYMPTLAIEGKGLASLNTHITSEGWSSFLSYQGDTDPVRFNTVERGVLNVSPQEAHLFGADTTEPYAIEHNYVQDLNVQGDAMVYETRLRVNPFLIHSRCYNIVCILQGEQDKVRINFAKPGCMSIVRVRFADKVLRGSHDDLSAFEQDFTQWRIVRVEVKNKKVNVFLDNTLLYSTRYQHTIGKIKGITYKLTGNGFIDYVKVSNTAGQVVYRDDFGG